MRPRRPIGQTIIGGIPAQPTLHTLPHTRTDVPRPSQARDPASGYLPDLVAVRQICRKVAGLRIRKRTLLRAPD